MFIAIASNRFINLSVIVAVRLEPKLYRAQLCRLHEGRLDAIGVATGTAKYQHVVELTKD